MRHASNFKLLISKFIPPSLRGVLEQIQDSKSLQNLNSLRSGYLPWTGSAIRAKSIEIVINEIVIHQRKLIVECGGGISTILLGSIMKKVGGKVICLENDEKWAAFIRTQIPDDYPVQIVTAPLEKSDGVFWYERAAVQSALENEAVDLLLIDGPISSAGKLMRYPAVAAIKPFLCEDFCIILDDIHRSEEQKTVRKLLKENDFVERLYLSNGGLAVLRPVGSKSTYNIV